MRSGFPCTRLTLAAATWPRLWRYARVRGSGSQRLGLTIVSPSLGGVWQGEVLISVEIIPKEKAEKKKAGLGRKEPNQHPFLPKPTGRMKFVRPAACVTRPQLCLTRPFLRLLLLVLLQSLNPLYVFNECLGPALCKKFCCCLACLVIVLACVLGAPFLNVIFALPKWLLYPLLVIALTLICGPVVYVVCLRDCCKKEEDEDDPNEESKPLIQTLTGDDSDSD